MHPRPHVLLTAEQGPYALALLAVTAEQTERWGRSQRRLRRHERRLAGFRSQRRAHLGLRQRRPGQRGAGRRAAAPGVLALAFASSAESAATLARTALTEPFAVSWERQLTAWTRWHAANASEEALAADLPDACAAQVQISTMVLRVHQDKTYPGAMVASLSVPWGNTREEREGYHLVWPRDLCESAGALLAVGALREARNTLGYLIATQNEDGHWNQNQWLGGAGHWLGIQLDETAFPVLLAAALEERAALAGTDVADMVLRALGFLVRQGPVSDQDRWEEDAGLNTFTLAVCIAALVAGARSCRRRRASWRSRLRTTGMRSWRSGPAYATRRSRDSTACPVTTYAWHRGSHSVVIAVPQNRAANPQSPGRPEPAGECPGERGFPAAGALRPAPRR